jgi:hypothetical protein
MLRTASALRLLIALGAAAPEISSAAPDVEFTIDSSGQTATGVIPEPADCFGPFSVLDFVAALSNGGDSAVSTTLLAVSPGWELIPDSCTATTGTCIIQTPTTFSWSGVIDAHGIAGVFFFARVNSDTPVDTELCAQVTAQFGDDPPITERACFLTNSARQCGLGAPVLGSGAHAVLAGLLCVGGVALLRRRQRRALDQQR